MEFQPADFGQCTEFFSLQRTRVFIFLKSFRSGNPARQGISGYGERGRVFTDDDPLQRVGPGHTPPPRLLKAYHDKYYGSERHEQDDNCSGNNESQ